MSLSVLVVDDDKVSRTIIAQRLNAEGYLAEAHESPFSALSALDKSNWDIVVTDLCMPSMDGIQLLKEIKQRCPDTAVIIMTAFGNVETALAALRAGAADYISKPFDYDELKVRLELLEKQCATRREVAQLRRAPGGGEMTYCGMLGSSPQMRRVFDLIERFADNPTNILIEGETGTGKEQVARALHDRSANAKGPFVALGCANVPRELAESELFGHEAGAFTGATKRRKGRIELAQGGTLFLDDVDDMPLELQGKLLRVIQERQYERVGSETTQTAEVRIISATKTDLLAHVAAGKFRDDLMYRLRVLIINLPPLRERREEILLLAHHFIAKLSEQRKRPPKKLGMDAAALLLAHNWPGNVRELRHAMEYALALSTGDEIMTTDLPSNLQAQKPTHAAFSLLIEGRDKVDMRDLVDHFEQEIITWALKRAGGNQGKAADLLSIPRTTLQSKLKKTNGNGKSDPGMANGDENQSAAAEIPPVLVESSASN